MGLPALKYQSTARPVRPRLALVDQAPSARTHGRSSAASHMCHSARCRETFRMFVAITLLFSALGIARVALSSRAAAVSIESGRMSTKVKAARFEGDSLEIKISQLATPSRIRAIAGKKMKMAPAARISYMTIDGSAKPPATRAQPNAPVAAQDRAPSAGKKAGETLLTSILHTAAGEAQVLLLGDVGLSSSR